MLWLGWYPPPSIERRSQYWLSAFPFFTGRLDLDPKCLVPKQPRRLGQVVHLGQRQPLRLRRFAAPVDPEGADPHRLAHRPVERLARGHMDDLGGANPSTV